MPTPKVTGAQENVEVSDQCASKQEIPRLEEKPEHSLILQGI